MAFQNPRKHPQRDRKVLMSRVGSSMGVLEQDNSPQSLAPELPSLGLGVPPSLVLKSRDGTARGESPGTQLSREQRLTEGSRRARLPGGWGGGGAALPPGSSLLPESSASSILFERPGGRPRQLHRASPSCRVRLWSEAASLAERRWAPKGLAATQEAASGR